MGRPADVESLRARPAANLLAGGVGGLASLVVGHPFDTVKVRLQTSQDYTSGRDCLARLLRHEGPAALYRGMAGLAIFSVPRFAILFYVNCWGRKLAGAEGSELTIGQVLAGGVLSQMAVSPLLVAPLERVKVVLQAHPASFHGQLDCLRHILQAEGPHGLLRGSLLTLARDVPSFCSYFTTYELLRARYKSPDGRMDLATTAAIGGLAGTVGWAVAIPIDALKNRHQAHLGQQSLAATVRDVGRQGGAARLYRGAGVVLLRAFPANSATFIGYEWTLRGLLLLSGDNAQ
jgi:solute carrier family 25 carnitine/acylcarnitine transporter 20/29